MPRKLPIEELCRKYQNENFHTEHVTRLALLLFDRTYVRLGLDLAERPLLEAAGRLHDVGYSVDPRRHGFASGEIIRREGAAGFSASDRRCIAAAVMMHPRKSREVPRAKTGLKPGETGRALRLAAFLRVADGLDHGHIQNLVVRSVRWRGNAYRVLVHTPGYTNNVMWASAKADLWARVFPFGLLFDTVAASEDYAPLFAGVVRSTDSIVETARRIFYSQFRIISENAAGAVAAENPEHLHDIRVANRRFRAALRLFRSRLEGTSAPRLRFAFSEAALAVGPARDMDVWIAFLKNLVRREGDAAQSAWRDYLECQQNKRGECVRALPDLLRGPQARSTMEGAAWFLRVELPQLVNCAPQEPLTPFLVRKLRRTFQRITGHAAQARSESAHEMHELRRLCRRERYWAEFAEPLLGVFAHRLVRRLKAIADALGDLHDTDVHLEHIGKDSVAPPPQLREHLVALRERHLNEFQETWARLSRKAFQKDALQRLDAADRGGGV